MTIFLTTVAYYYYILNCFAYILNRNKKKLYFYTSLIFVLRSSYRRMPLNFPGILRQKSKFINSGLRHLAATILERTIFRMQANSSGTVMSWSCGSTLKMRYIEAIVIYCVLLNMSCPTDPCQKKGNKFFHSNFFCQLSISLSFFCIALNLFT